MRRAPSKIRLTAHVTRVALSTLALAAACAGGDATTPKPRPAGRMTFVVTTSLAVPGPVDSYSGARVRVIAADGAAAGTAILAQVMPVSYPWEAPVVAPVPLELEGVTATRAVVEVELLDWKDSTTVHWAARSDTLALRDGPVALPLRFGRGPIGNLAVERVRIAPAGGGAEPLLMAVGEEASLVIETPEAVERFRFFTDPRVIVPLLDTVVIALAPGTTKLVVVAGLHADTLDVTVQPRAATLVLEPSMVELSSFGDTVQFTVRGRDSSGAEVRPGAVWWRSAPGAPPAPVGISGQFVSRANGEFAVEAVLFADTTVRGTARVVVRQRLASITLAPSGGTLSGIWLRHAINARARDARGYFIDSWPAAPQWSLASPVPGMQLEPGPQGTQYLLPNGHAGDASVTVAVGEVRAEANYRVVPRLASVIVSGASKLRPGETAQFTATARDELGEVAQPALTWSSSDTSIATVNATGLVTARRDGRVLIIANEPSGFGGSQVLEVVSAPAALRIASDDPAVGWNVQGNSVLLEVQVLDRFGIPVPGVEVHWAAPDGGTLTSSPPVSDAGGVVTAIYVVPGFGTHQVLANVVGTNITATLHVIVAMAQPSYLEVVQAAPDSVTSGVAWGRQPVLRYRDVNGQPMQPAGIPVRVRLSSPPPSATLSGQLTATTDAEGFVRFEGLTLTGPPGLYTLSFESSGLDSPLAQWVYVR